MTTGNQQALFNCAGMHITKSDNTYHIDQDFYISKIEQMRIRLAWLANTRFDTVFENSQITLVTRTMYEKDISRFYKRLN